MLFNFLQGLFEADKSDADEVVNFESYLGIQFYRVYCVWPAFVMFV